MATKPATPIRQRKMVEVKAPELFQFTKTGQHFGGVLLQIEPTELTNKQSGQRNSAIEYMFQNPDGGARWTCLGTNDLNKKLNPAMIGHYIEVRYENDDSSFQKQGQSPMKVFKVTISQDKEPGFESFGV